MNKAFTREPEGDDEDDEAVAGAPPLPSGSKNYMTPQGHLAMRAELIQLIDDERPKMVETVSWAAWNGGASGQRSAPAGASGKSRRRGRCTRVRQRSRC